MCPAPLGSLPNWTVEIHFLSISAYGLEELFLTSWHVCLDSISGRFWLSWLHLCMLRQHPCILPATSIPDSTFCILPFFDCFRFSRISWFFKFSLTSCLLGWTVPQAVVSCPGTITDFLGSLFPLGSKWSWALEPQFSLLSSVEKILPCHCLVSPRNCYLW